MRPLMLCTLLTLAAGAGLWFGESLSGPLPSVTALLVFGGLAFAAWLVGRALAALRVAFALGCLALALGSWALGRAEAQRAYHACLDEGRGVLERLQQFQTRTGRLPDSLDELGGKVPCQRWLRGSLLDYSSLDGSPPKGAEGAPRSAKFKMTVGDGALLQPLRPATR